MIHKMLMFTKKVSRTMTGSSEETKHKAIVKFTCLDLEESLSRQD